MRRIAHPQRLDAALHACTRPRLAPAYTPAAAAFSTTAARPFLLPGGKQDKKKHQQFVRRWQKRLLGDAEPIGAHVDPYDPSSPVRIAPEDQGEELEVLADETGGGVLPVYRKAKGTSGLQRVGGEAWRAHRSEVEMAREFEKLTLRTYTPLSLPMADAIEDLTGTPYTLADENLLQAQTVHQVTNRPYTHLNFGLYPRTQDADKLRRAFAQAVAEVYTLHSAGVDMDLARLPNRGVYRRPDWLNKVKLTRAADGQLALAFPRHASADRFLRILHSAPDMSAFEPEAEMDELVEELVEPVVPEAAAPVEPVPTMDPATPEFKRAAMVKQDEEKKAFDFMSNRPTPRKAAPVEAAAPVVEEVVEVIEEAPVEEIPVQKTPVKETKAAEKTLAENVAKLRAEEPQVEEVKWRHAPIASPEIKFALFKRLYQLTGIRISDPNLGHAHTLGDLYGLLSSTAKPNPGSLFSTLHVEGQRAREKAKKTAAAATDAPATKRRADLGDLLHLSNVEIRRNKPTKSEERTKRGIEKVISYAMRERGLKTRGHRKRKVHVNEGTRRTPEFGRPVSVAGAKLLARKANEHNRRLKQRSAE